MTPSEIEQFALALSTAIKRSGLIAAVDQLSAPGNQAKNPRQQADGSKRVMFSTATAMKSLTKVANQATSSLRELSKASLNSVIGLSHFTSALQDSTKKTIRGKNTRSTKSMPTVEAADISSALAKAVGLLKEAERADRRAELAEQTKWLERKERREAARREKAERLNSKPETKPEDEEPKPKPKPTETDRPSFDVAPTEMNHPKQQLEWQTFPERFQKRIFEPFANFIDDEISKRVAAYSKFEEDEAAAQKNRREAIDHNVAQLGFFASKSISIIFQKSLESLDIMFDTLAARGYGTSKSFSQIAIDSARAGMSIQDYTRMMDDSMAVVSRSTSFADFNKKLSYGAEQLKSLGIFGADANKGIAALMTSSTQLGIPQDQLSNALDGQIAQFKKLQKTTGITITDFARLSSELSNTTSFQTELSALEPSERAARQREVLAQYSYAKALGVSEKAQSDYTQAVLEQRRSTVKTRYNQAGRLMQAGGLVGMGADQIEEMRRLSLNRNKSETEQKRYMDLLGQLGSGMEKVQQQGGPGSQYQMDVMKEALDSQGMSSAMDAAMAIKLNKESGTQKNKDMTASVSTIDKNLGELFTLIKGWGSNPFGQAVVGIAGAMTALVASMKFGFIQRNIGETIGKTAGRIIADSMHGTAHASTDIKNAQPISNPSKWGKRAVGALGVAEAGFGAVSAYGNYNDAKKQEAELGGETPETSAAKTGAVADGALLSLGAIMSTVGAVASGPFAPVTAALGAVVSGLGAFGAGSFFAKMFTTQETVIEKNARETQKLTKELNEQRKAQASDDVFDANNLSGLAASAVRAGIAGSTASAEDLKGAGIGVKTPSQISDEQTAAYFMSADEQLAVEERKKKVAAAADTTAAAAASAKADASAAALAAGVNPVPLVSPSASMQSSINAAAIATPVTPPPSRVNPTTVNTPDAPEPDRTPQTTKTERGTSDQTAVLQQQNSIMDKHTSLLQQQIEATENVARLLGLRPSQPSSESLQRRALYGN